MKLGVWSRLAIKGQRKPIQYAMWGEPSGRFIIRCDMNLWMSGHRWSLYDSGKRVAYSKRLRTLVARWVSSRLEGKA